MCIYGGTTIFKIIFTNCALFDIFMRISDTAGSKFMCVLVYRGDSLATLLIVYWQNSLYRIDSSYWSTFCPFFWGGGGGWLGAIFITLVTHRPITAVHTLGEVTPYVPEKISGYSDT
jgi:hypothetical protein